MDLRLLRYFTAVVEAGSMTSAAARLHVSQPSLSVAVSRLESEVGVALLVRTPRGVRPTSAGRFLLGASARVLHDVDDIAASLARFGAGTAGTLTLAAVPVLVWHRVPRLLRALARDAPDLEVQLVDPPPWTAIDMLLERSADVAAVVVAHPGRFARQHRGVLDVADWGEVPLVAALPPEEHEAPDPLPLHALAGRTVLLPRRTAAVPSLPERVEEALARHDVAPAAVRTVGTIQVALPLVEAGVGAAVLPDPDHASLHRFDVTLRRLDPAPPPLRALVLSRAGAAASDARVARLLRHARRPAPRGSDTI
ncbi:LysR family transcriptional regulator [Cellulomonas sp. IC4_254]|uniref:LysR family transcriptional regulator n=1 Tax=Cellulomonas sp. IC4_254 TaxID=2714040 RepID=UPI001421D0AC|nr:LysR family transcriptional regulator [Cellulomonas sp. IC4_254]NHT16100.1 LysR family transcriptional regulator [Cellulomonas sp. IC4_254]